MPHRSQVVDTEDWLEVMIFLRVPVDGLIQEYRKGNPSNPERLTSSEVPRYFTNEVIYFSNFMPLSFPHEARREAMLISCQALNP